MLVTKNIKSSIRKYFIKKTYSYVESEISKEIELDMFLALYNI